MTPLQRVTRVMNEISGVKAQFGVDEWEWGFLDTMKRRAPETLTTRQEKCLADLERKVFGTEEAES